MSLPQTIQSCIDVPFMDLKNISELIMSYTQNMPETIVEISLSRGQISFKKHRMSYENFKTLLIKKPEFFKKIFDSGFAQIDLICKKTKTRYFRSTASLNELKSYIETFTAY